MALPLAVLALVIVAALVAVSLAGSLVEQRVGRNGLYAVQAAGAADAGVAEVVGGWEAHGLGGMAVGETTALPAVRLPGRTEYASLVTRLNAELFRIRVQANRTDADGEGLAAREAGLIVRVADSGSASVRPLSNRAWFGMVP